MIDNAADRVTMHLRSVSIGPNGAIAQKLLNEVAAARVCLLNSDQRSQYDQVLARHLVQQQPGTPVATSSPLIPVAQVVRIATQPVVPILRPPAASLPPLVNAPNWSVRNKSVNRRNSASSGIYELTKIIAGGVLGLVIAQTILFYAANIDIFGVMGRLHGKRRPKSPTTIAASPSLPPTDSRPASPKSYSSSPAIPPFPQKTVPESTSPSPPAPVANPPPPPSPPSLPPTTKAPEIHSVGNGEHLLDPAEVISALPRSLNLPPLVDSGPRKLLELRTSAAIGLSLVDVNCSIPKNAAFVIEKLKTRPEWRVDFYPNVEETSTAAQEVARLQFRDGGLWFNWTETVMDGDIRQQLRNCFLRIDIEGKQKVIVLREPKKESHFVVDLTKPVSVQLFEMADLPSDKAIAIRFGDLNRFSRGATWKNDLSSVALGKNTVVEFGQVAGARLEFSFVKKTKDILAVTMRPVFLEKQPVEMTLNRLSKMETEIPQQISVDQNSLQSYMSQRSSLSSDLTSIQGYNPSNLFEVNVKNQRIVKVQGDIKRVSSRINQLQLRISQMQAKLAILPQMRAFLEELHGKASIEFSVEVGEGPETSVLVTSTGS